MDISDTCKKQYIQLQKTLRVLIAIKLCTQCPLFTEFILGSKQTAITWYDEHFCDTILLRIDDISIDIP